jgi:cytochrome c-type biogenesis protein
MDGMLLASASAFWLGVLTSVSPCPLATNVVAISYIGRGVASPKRVFLTGLAYTAGRVLAYILLGSVVVASALSIPQLSTALQLHMSKALGPLLILAGMFMLELIRLPGSGSAFSGRIQQLARRGGFLGAGLLGMLFALSFCPLSAALFFGSLIPLSLAAESRLALPSLYGIGTGVPVLVFAVLLATGVRSLGTAFNRLAQWETWARSATGLVFIVVGFYLALTLIFGVGA